MGPGLGAGDAERGGIVLGWLARLVVVLSLLGVLTFDAVAVGVAHVSLPDHAGVAARAASETWQSSRSAQQAYDVARSVARSRNPGNEVDVRSFSIEPDGTVHLRVRRSVTTFVLRHVGPVAGWADVASAGSGRYAV